MPNVTKIGHRIAEAPKPNFRRGPRPSDLTCTCGTFLEGADMGKLDKAWTEHRANVQAGRAVRNLATADSDSFMGRGEAFG